MLNLCIAALLPLSAPLLEVVSRNSFTFPLLYPRVPECVLMDIKVVFKNRHRFAGNYITIVSGENVRKNYQKELSLPCVEFFIDIVKSFASESQTQMLFSVNKAKLF